MEKIDIIRSQARRLRLSSLAANVADILLKAQRTTPSYDDLLTEVLQMEIDGRDQKQVVIRLRVAKLPVNHDLNLYDQSISNGLSLVQLKQLRELHWVEECYNILLAGPSGVGKTFIAAGLLYDAILKGYKGVFRSMERIIGTLKRKDISAVARKEYKDLSEAQIIVIDDIMNVTVDREEGNMLFAFINAVYETTSFIITTNKSPVEWARTLPDEVLGTALLDRLLFKCELIQLSGDSYRMKHRKTIFEKQDNKYKTDQYNESEQS